MVLVLLLLLVERVNSQSKWCSDLKCSTCLAGYKYTNIKCLSICPTGHSISGSNCVVTSSLTLFSFSPGIPLAFDARSVEMFYHPAGLQLRDPGRQSPIMTKDRGLYFAKSSMLISNTSWILSPEFHLVLTVRVINQGVIFKVSNKEQVFLEISGNRTTFLGNVLISYPTGNKSEILNNAHPDEWVALVFIVNENIENIYIHIFGREYIFLSGEYRPQIQGLNFTLGAPENNSFEGFLYDIYLQNDLYYIKYMYISDILCGFNEYYFNDTCIKCNPSCSEWPWCVRNGCNLCFYSNCSSCINFKVDSCIDTCLKIENKCALGFGCLQGSLFNCTTCSSEFIMIKGVCIIPPYKYNPTNLLTPVIKTKFIEFKQYYDIFQSGINASTYSPYNKSESDDPYPVKSRGMAFQNEKIVFLKSTFPITLSCEFTIALWIITFNSGQTVDKQTLKIFSNHRGAVELANEDDRTLISSLRFGEAGGRWRFLALRLKVESNMTSIYLKNDGSDLLSNTVKGLAFNDQNTSLFLGNNKKTSFNGIIYSISVWQTFVSDLSSEMIPCGVGLGSSCLNECPINKYYNAIEDNCFYCSSACKEGCNSFGKCSSCAQTNCTMCSSYESNATCFQTSSAYCISGLKVGKNGECCHNSCSSCYGQYFYMCYSCSMNYVLVGSVCYSSCPLGFLNVSSICILLNSSTVDIKFDKISKSPTSSLFPIQFNVANISMFYPNFSVFNPIPAFNRGYYFGKNSSITSSSLNLSYNQTFSIWIRIISDGNIFKRGTLSISTQTIQYFNINQNIYLQIMSWSKLNILISTRFDTLFAISVNQNNNQTYYRSSWNAMIMDSSSSIVLGDSISSFKGFIYRLALFNIAITDFVYSELLSACPFLTYEEKGLCYDCQTSCQSGCITSKGCNLCNQPLCKICSNFSENSCSECFNTAAMVNGVCTCLNGTYWNLTTWNCEKCLEPCLNCLNTSFCSSCIQDSTLENNRCICNQGFYFDLNTLKCLNCFLDCKTCYGNLESNCQSCRENAYLASEGKCICFDGYYMDSGECKKCHGLCSKCFNFTNCTNCKAGSNNIQGTCKCPTGLFADLQLGLCKSCDSKCLTCSELSGLTCTSCNKNSYLIDNSCHCNLGLFWDSAASSCSFCDSLCLDCSSLTNCTICKEKTLNIGGICTCLDGFYKSDDLNASCLICHENCLKCTGPLSNQCVDCRKNAVIQDDFSCRCLSGYFMLSGNCEKCSKFCIECLDAVHCLVCHELSFVSGGICKCADRFFNSINEDICQSCHPKCFNCFDNTEISCISCPSNSSLSGTQCICNKGFFWDEENFICQECDGLCSDCISKDTCNQCKSNSDLYNGTCYCLEGFFRTKWLPVMCQPCSPQCFTCFGASSFNCVQCKPLAFLLPDYSCQCFNGLYFDSLSYKCENCSDLCKTCSGIKTSCTSCNSNFYLSTNSCRCVDGYYLNFTTCEPCHISCKTCKGPSEQECLSCTSKAILSNNYTCNCIANYFMKLGTCIACYPSCLTCLAETEQNCSSCKEGLIFQNNGECKCEPPLFWDAKLKACIPCSNFCLTCNAFNITGCDICSTDCFFCTENSIYQNTSCICIEGYFERNNICLKCNEKCKTCKDETYYSCTSCNNTFLNGGLCIDKCPLGYLNREGVCQMKGSQGIVMSFKFNYFSEHYSYALTGIQLKPPIDLNFPLPVFSQGLYFNGQNSAVQIESPEEKNRLFSDEFLLSFWIMTYSNTGALIKSSTSNVTELSLTFQENLFLTLLFSKITSELNSNQSIPISEWTFVAISLSHNSPTSVSFIINLEKQTFFSISEEPFTSQDNCEVLLGCDREKQSFFHGFIYKVDLRRNSTNLMISTNCKGCSLCLEDSECLTTCSITEYFEKSSQSCKPCMAECLSGCRHKSSCGMCFESECLTCLDFDSGSCTSCREGYQVTRGTCEKCEGLVFYNSSSKLCEKCKGLCVTCLSEFECLSCEGNAEVVNKSCVCSLGYYLNVSYCERVMFGSMIKISLDNSAQVIFDEPLNKDLTSEDVQVFYNNNPCKFKVTTKDPLITSFQCEITWNVRAGSSIKIEFLKPVTSIHNSLLSTKNLTIGLFPTQIEEIFQKIQQAKDFANKGTTVGASVSLCLSVASFDVSSLFSFVNFAEIFSVISLYGLELEEDLLEFLRSVRVQKSLPNVFEGFSEGGLGIDLNENLVEYGYKSNSAIINSGVSILIFLVIFFCFLLVRIMVPIMHEKIPKLLVVKDYFHFSVFLKFWIQTCLDLMITSMNAIFHGYFKSLFYFADYCCSVIMIVSFKQVSQLVLFLVSLVLVKKRRKLVESEEILSFDKKFGAFFNEFKSDPQNFYFYPIFFVRRFLVALVIFLVKVPILRLVFSFVLSLMVKFNQNLFYLVETRCFKSKANNVLHIFNEILTGFLHIAIIAAVVKNKNELKNNATDICINIITIAWALNMVCSVVKLIGLVAEKIKKFRNRKKVENIKEGDITKNEKIFVESIEETKTGSKNEQIFVEDLEFKQTDNGSQAEKPGI